MREIKFRAWNIQNERVVYEPYRFELYNGKYRFTETWQDEEDGIFRDCEIMQYTGLKDKNGKEIYEGDILQFYKNHKDNKAEKIIKEVVEWSGQGWQPYDMTTESEIIGNIYENPELLK